MLPAGARNAASTAMEAAAPAAHLDAVRRLLAGEEVTVQGRYARLDGVRLEFPPERAPPVPAGVRGPRSRGVSGRHADGTLPAEPVTPAYLAAARASIARGQDADSVVLSAPGDAAERLDRAAVLNGPPGG
nr:LLM class flavin-dependent oxidoreductase [Actinorugispora endophytica]